MASELSHSPIDQEKSSLGDESARKSGKQTVKTTTDEIVRSIVYHAQTTLARPPQDLDEESAYRATAYAVRDDLIVNLHDTELSHSSRRVKRACFLSSEFLAGRTLINALLNLGTKDRYEEAAVELGFKDFNKLVECERDAPLGIDGLDSLTACYLDSGATCELPLSGYGLRFHYNMLRQQIDTDGSQIEAPDLRPNYASPWEIHRPDVTYPVRFYGSAQRLEGGKGVWSGGQEVFAVAFDVPIPGYHTRNTNNVRLWDAKAKSGFDPNLFNADHYAETNEASNSAESLTLVLYPTDDPKLVQELRLKQQYFWTAASLADIMGCFKQIGKPIAEFSNYFAIQLNDTHPALAIPELMRILIDDEEVSWDEAYKITQTVFCYTNHAVHSEALEKWPVALLERVLPRHFQIISDLNTDLLQQIQKRFPDDSDRLSRMSLIQEGPQGNVCMDFLAIVGSRKVNSVGEFRSALVETAIFRDFFEFYGSSKFGNITNGITPRRWLDQCNPALSELITDTLKCDKIDWLRDLTKLNGLLGHANDDTFVNKWAIVKQKNKQRLADFIEQTVGVKLNTLALFDIQVGRLHESRRQSMNILGVVHRYSTLKALPSADRKGAGSRVILFGGKAASGDSIAKLVIRLINNVAKVINADPDMKDILTVLFVPDYSVSLAELLIPASDISEHISTAGTEASGTSNMKVCLNGGLLLGTVDGTTLEIAEEIGEDNAFFFGHSAPAVEDVRFAHKKYPRLLKETSPALAIAIQHVTEGKFGDSQIYEPLLNTIRTGDHYLVSEDFDSYIEAQGTVDLAFQNKKEWMQKSITTTAKMGKFSSDRVIMDYAREWNIERAPAKVTEG